MLPPLLTQVIEPRYQISVYSKGSVCTSKCVTAYNLNFLFWGNLAKFVPNPFIDSNALKSFKRHYLDVLPQRGISGKNVWKILWKILKPCRKNLTPRAFQKQYHNVVYPHFFRMLCLCQEKNEVVKIIFWSALNNVFWEKENPLHVPTLWYD